MRAATPSGAHSWEARIDEIAAALVAMSDLLVTAITPTLGSGTGLRTYGVVAALARHGPVEVAYVVWGAPEPAAEYRWLANVTLRELRASRGPRRAVEYALARAARRAARPRPGRLAGPAAMRRARHRQASG